MRLRIDGNKINKKSEEKMNCTLSPLSSLLSPLSTLLSPHPFFTLLVSNHRSTKLPYILYYEYKEQLPFTVLHKQDIEQKIDRAVAEVRSVLSTLSRSDALRLLRECKW